jgi:hypothetical protein
MTTMAPIRVMMPTGYLRPAPWIHEPSQRQRPGVVSLARVVGHLALAAIMRPWA